MNRLLSVALGILAAIGGFVDIGDIVFNVAGGRDVRLRAALGGHASVSSESSSTPRCADASRPSPSAPSSTSCASALGLRRRLPRRSSARSSSACSRSRPRSEASRSRCSSSSSAALPGAARRSPSSPSPLVLLGDAVRVDRARLRLHGGSDLLVFVVAAVKLQSRLGSDRRTASSQHRRHSEPRALRLLRRRADRRGDDAVRGLLLLVGRDRGTTGAPKDLSPNRANAMIGYCARRPSLLRAA